MEDIYLKIGLILGAIIFSRIMLNLLIPNEDKQQENTLSKEYVDIINNPEYKVKGKYT